MHAPSAASRAPLPATILHGWILTVLGENFSEENSRAGFGKLPMTAVAVWIGFGLVEKVRLGKRTSWNTFVRKGHDRQTEGTNQRIEQFRELKSELELEIVEHLNSALTNPH